MQEIEVMLSILKRSGQYGQAKISTRMLAGELGVSQQNISIQLRKLETKGYINRQPTNYGTTVSFTEKGLDILRDMANRIQSLTKPVDKIKGTLFTGLGEGRFYTGLPGYHRQFKKRLLIDAYPGTLNLRVNPLDRRKFLYGKKEHEISGFSSKKRVFGPLKAYLVNIGKIRCALLIPKRSIHKDTIEIISKINLRKKLNLTDGDVIEVSY